MTDAVDPASLRPGDVVDVVDRLRITVQSVGGQIVKAGDWGSIDLSPGPFGRGWTRESHLVSRAEPERGSVWRYNVRLGAEFFYEPDTRWPAHQWVRLDNGNRADLPLADMTFVRSAADG